MKSLLKVAFIIFFLCDTVSYGQENQPLELNENFTHVVYFWLNNPENPDDRQAFEKSLKQLLASSKYAQTKFIGVPAQTPREVVDNSYTYSLILSFSSREEQDKYQKEPAHLAFIKESEHLWKKVQVYDSTGIK
ncbi:Dabb family protein [Christiangramia sabulilitoris]|uniref:Dabb family protein n=1 Tax=Christiangramia sabulilitoris TaxID=2583991 RepID=A0A550I856_9FLAO|nr:Dabb family protein [Christiangramia sabulilitoris]TRO67136.1 Dabb family protein [Christiangramia sabulilitoris]